jgi:hypothetical protein
MRHPHPLTRAALVGCTVIGLPLVTLCIGWVWLTGEHQAGTAAWRRTRRPRTLGHLYRQPNSARDAETEYDRWAA